jgi:hypothetical protein
MRYRQQQTIQSFDTRHADPNQVDMRGGNVACAFACDRTRLIAKKRLRQPLNFEQECGLLHSGCEAMAKRVAAGAPLPRAGARAGAPLGILFIRCQLALGSDHLEHQLID